MTTRTFDYTPRLDQRNLAYRVSAQPDLSGKPRYWTPGVVLDQGQEGSCVGHGVVGEYVASPARGKLVYNPAWKSVTRADMGHSLAVAVYNRAKEIDEWEGSDYDGTSVRAGMLVAREHGWCSGFRWALNMAELRTALEEGPVVVGVEWRSGMYEPYHGDLIPTGSVVGGHCLLVTGYSARTKSYRLLNSWGPDWGHRGQAYITDTDLDRILFQAGGEAAVAQGRHL